MKNIHVLPVSDGLNLKHPSGGVLPDDGGLWPDDQFTARRLRDKDIKLYTPETDENTTQNGDA